MATQHLSTSGVGFDPATLAVFITQSGPNGLTMVAAPAPSGGETPATPESQQAQAKHDPAHHQAPHKK